MKNKIYTFSVPTKIIIGCGSLRNLPEVTQGSGKRILLVTGRGAMKKSGILDRVIGLLGGGITLFDRVEPEVSTDTVNAGAKLAREKKSETIIGLGGGSALDAAKAIAGIANKSRPVEEYLLGEKLESPGLPFIAIPTTGGTGSEVTPNAVLIDRRRGTKTSFRSTHLFAGTALIDPELTLPAPPRLTAYAGMDALCQAIESFTSLGANDITDGLAVKAIKLIAGSLLKVYRDGSDIQARTDMAYGALLSGITLSNAGLGLIHGIAPSVGVRYELAHGLLCGLLLPAGMEFNLRVSAKKYAGVAKIFGEDIENLEETEAAGRAISAIKKLLTALGFPSGLKELGVTDEHFPDMAKESMSSGSLKVNPRKVTEADAVDILRKAL